MESIKSAEKLTGLQRAIEVHQLRITKLQGILVNENLTSEQAEKIQERLDQAVNNTEHLKEVQAAKIEKIQNISVNTEKGKTNKSKAKEPELENETD
jgi:alanine racemase